MNLASKSKNSLSKPQPSERRSLKITPHGKLSHLRFRKLSEFRYLAYIDFSRFYHSIYTHSLPWAAHGKAASKKDTKFNSTDVYFNQIDTIVRNSQDGQTLGIPVGPDSSRVLAEIVNSSIDEAFEYEEPEAVFVRHVDDVWIGANTYEEGQELLNAYRQKILEFELDINDSKTQIRLNHMNIVDRWPRMVSSMIETYVKQEDDYERTAAFLNVAQYCFEEAFSSNDSAVIRYALKKLDDNEIWSLETEWNDFESFLLQCAIHFPHSIDHVMKVLIWRHVQKRAIDREKWQGVLSRIITEHSKVQNDSEVLWALWCCLLCGFNISSQTATIAITTRCDFVGILLLLLNDAKLVTGKLEFKTLSQYFDLNDLSGSNWLMAHEVRIRDWIPKGELSDVNDNSLLKELRSNKVSFVLEAILSPVFMNDDGTVVQNTSEIKKAIEDGGESYDDVDISDLISDLTLEEFEATFLKSKTTK